MQHVINLTGVKLPERNRGTERTRTKRAGSISLSGMEREREREGERERERGRRLFKQKEIQKGREGAQRGNDFLSPLSLSLSLPVASKRENVISIRHTCHEKVEGEREREEGRERATSERERSGDIVDEGDCKRPKPPQRLILICACDK